MTDDIKIEEAEKIELRVREDTTAVAVNLPEQYEIQELIGQGGMGQVFKARIKGVSEPVAVKVLKKELCSDAQALKRFQQEITAVSSLSHSNIVEVFEHGITKDGVPYLTMKYIDGESLETLLQKHGAMEWKRAADLFLQICEALEYAHSKGTVHRDLKPSNIIISRNDSGDETAHVADFGIAKLVTAGGDTLNTLTSAGEFLGTPAYMSPEQCLGNAVDHRSDIYALGGTLFAALSGKSPYAGCGTVETIAKKLSDDTPPELSSPAIPSKMKILVASCMNRKERDRYSSVQKLKQDLAAISKGETAGSHLISPVLDSKAFGKRVIAILVDYFVISGCYGLFSMCFYLLLIPLSILTVDSSSEYYGITFFGGILFWISLIVFFTAWMESKFGATPGKLLMRLSLCNLEGKKLSLKHAIGRAFTKGVFLVGIPCVIVGVIGAIRHLQHGSGVDGAIGIFFMSISIYAFTLIAVTISLRQFPWDLLSRTRVRRKN